jgi:hypothetical protein
LTTPYGAPVPSALPESPLSINFRIPEVPGGPQLTVRAGTAMELAGLTEDVARHGAQIGHALVEFRAGFLAGSGMPDAPSTPAAPQPAYQAPPEPQYQNPTPPPAWAAPATPQAQYSMPAQPQPPQTGGQGQAPSCPHGVRVYKAGVSSAGKPYKMWACQMPQGPDQCKPEWVK